LMVVTSSTSSQSCACWLAAFEVQQQVGLTVANFFHHQIHRTLNDHGLIAYESASLIFNF
jgi:hypothetical protein